MDTQRGQTKTYENIRIFGLPTLSPYFQMNETRKEDVGRDTNSTKSLMAVTRVIATQIFTWNQDLAVNAQFYDGNTWVNEYNIELNDLSQYDTLADLYAEAISKIVTYSSGQGYTAITSGAQIMWLIPQVPPTMANAPQAAIANAPVDATTNYNTITTLLGSLTGAVNTANDKQNQIGTQLNSLLAELRTLGLIAT